MPLYVLHDHVTGPVFIKELIYLYYARRPAPPEHRKHIGFSFEAPEADIVLVTVIAKGYLLRPYVASGFAGWIVLLDRDPAIHSKCILRHIGDPEAADAQHPSNDVSVAPKPGKPS